MTKSNYDTAWQAGIQILLLVPKVLAILVFLSQFR
jgi:hypothetical protein